MKNSNHNKQWDDLNPKLVIDGGGELLERMNLPRSVRPSLRRANRL
jgi:hypothetical protein